MTNKEAREILLEGYPDSVWTDNYEQAVEKYNEAVNLAVEALIKADEEIEYYKEFVIDHGGDKKLFDLPAINNVIDYIIEYADRRLKMEGRSPIYYKCPNEDGTFDICGRMSGPSVTVVYKMEYCHDGNPEHYIVLKKYEQKSHFAGCYYYIDGCGYSKIYINKQGIIVEETKEIEISGFKNEGFLNELYEKKILKRDSLDMLLTKKKTL